MLTYARLKNNPRQFVSMTSLTAAEFAVFIPIFAAEYEASDSLPLTRAGKPRQRKIGGGNKPRLACLEDKLLFILIYRNSSAFTRV